MATVLKFPDGFLWGSATSAYQIEGGNHNDWSEWEQSPRRLESLKKRGEDPNLFMSGRACDSWNRWEKDVALLKELHQKVYRFSIEWSRVEPEEGKFDSDAIQRYISFVKSLCDAGIEPVVTLWHFTNPAWIQERGGWLNPSTPDALLRFIQVAVDNLKPYVKTWVTLNEATTVYAGLSYIRGVWPPQHKNIWQALRVARHMIRAHRLAYRAIHAAYEQDSPKQSHDVERDTNPLNARRASMSHNVRVGIVENLTYVVHGRRWYQRGLGAVYDYIRNHIGLSRMAPYFDFIGLNYYHVERRFGGTPQIFSPGRIVPDPYWELHAEGMYQSLKSLTRYKKPILITENGLPDAEDAHRGMFIRDHLHAVWRALQDGVDVRGYMHWSLLDNFEWASGYAPRFGLVAVDRTTLERTIRPSARMYAIICKDNQVTL